MKFFKHLKTVLKHKFWVGKYCAMAGIPIRGFFHDMSKFSPTEFFESVKYYQGTSSPIDASKKINGWSRAWQHHKGRNKHHFEYYWDIKHGKVVPLVMPYKDALEMLCDYLGAGRAYNGDKFTYKGEYEWWMKRKETVKDCIHPSIIEFITYELDYFMMLEKTNSPIIFNNAKEIYNIAITAGRI